MTFRNNQVKRYLPVLILFACSFSNSVFAVSKDHIELIKKYTCAVDKSSSEFKLMNSFLVQKDQLKDFEYPMVTKYQTRLVDYFVSPEYLRDNRLLPGSAILNSYSGSEPERLICIAGSVGSRTATTVLQYLGKNEWIMIFEYSLALENGQHFIRPIGPPDSFSPGTMKNYASMGSAAAFYANPHKVIVK